MMNHAIEKQILTLMNRMSEQQQQEVLDFARFLATTKPVGVPGKELLKFAGTISHEDAQIMLETAEENWGQADLKEWSH